MTILKDEIGNSVKGIIVFLGIVDNELVSAYIFCNGKLVAGLTQTEDIVYTVDDISNLHIFGYNPYWNYLDEEIALTSFTNRITMLDQNLYDFMETSKFPDTPYLIDLNKSTKECLHLITSNTAFLNVNPFDYKLYKNSIVSYRGIITDKSIPYAVAEIPASNIKNKVFYYLVYITDNSKQLYAQYRHKNEIILTEEVSYSYEQNFIYKDIECTICGFFIDMSNFRGYDINECSILLPTEYYVNDLTKWNLNDNESVELRNKLIKGGIGNNVLLTQFNFQEWQNKASFIRKLNNKKQQNIIKTY